jgi:5-dehydro-2-deoxygluconokinase
MEMPPEYSGAIVDDQYGFDALTAMNGSGRWLARPVEVAGSRPLEFAAGHKLHDTLRTWPAEHVIKCLVSYSTKDALGIRTEQQEKLTNLQEGVFATGHRWLLEMIPPEFQKEPGNVVEAVENLYELGLRPDWWKLPPLTDDHAWSEIASLISKHDPQCGGIIVLGYDKPEADLLAAFESALRSRHAVGFAVGRSIWREVATDWFKGLADDASAANAVRTSYENILNAWLKIANR